jgi:ATP-dependent helicase HrpA
MRYRFEPGDARDGVTLTVPVALLGELSQAMLDQLVPAWLAEKIEALLWSLPKSVRRALPTIQPYARELAATLRGDGRALQESLAERVRAVTGAALPAEALRDAA